MKETYTTKFSIPSGFGYDEQYRAEIADSGGQVNVRIFRIFKDGHESERTMPGGILRDDVTSAKRYVRQQFQVRDLRLKWKLEREEV